MSSIYSRRNRPTAGTVPLVRRTRMIREVSVLLGVCLALTRTAEAAQEPPVLVSPEVRADHTIIFRFWAPTAKEVQLSGDWIGGPPVKLTKDAQGVWTVTQGPLEPNI